VGDLRWHEPVPVKPRTEVRAASSFGFFAHPALSAESTHRGSGNCGLMD
jgi:carboxylesterase type B